VERETNEVGLPQLRGERSGGEESWEQSGKPESWEQTIPREVELRDRQEIMLRVQQQHKLAKAVKLDDAEVPIHIWDAAVFKRQPSEEERQALNSIRQGMMGFYRQRLWRECRDWMKSKFGPKWLNTAQTTSAPRHQAAVDELEAIQEILWQTAGNDWFEYPLGSRLLFFRFPKRYRSQALHGVRVMYTGNKPSSWKSQPPFTVKAKLVLQKKIEKFVAKGYIAPTSKRIRLLIKYFAVPKGLEDWRIVFDAGANKLNDVVWVPSFFLPTVNSLLRIVDDKSMMSDCNMGEMFHQFQLHEDTVLESGVDLGPLQLSTVECSQRYMVWRRSLMGFRPLPYNCIRMYLVAKEVIRGD
jgi:hypothetical protein